MNAYLFDTHLLLWFGSQPERLSQHMQTLMADRTNRAVFSAISTVEVAIKFAQRRANFRIDPGNFRRQLLVSGFEELELTGEHARRLIDLAPIHKDPWDRLLVAQALVEEMTFVTADAVLGGYPGQIMVV